MVSNLVDDPIPDVMIKVREKLATPPPTIEECKDAKEVNWNAFTSTWLSVSAKNIDIRYVIIRSEAEILTYNSVCIQ
jgi:hypothetical protein